MPELWMDVDTAVKVPVNIMPLLDDTDFKTIEIAVVYNSAGLALTWNFVTCAGVMTSTAVTPTDGTGVYDWSEPLADKGMYQIEIPASGGATINNDTEGVGWFTGVATGVLPWRGPTIGFRRAALNDLFIDGSTASTNMEDFFDGTGYVGGTAKLGVNVININGTAQTAGDVVADVAAVHVHVGTIDGHITADYTATEKAAIDLLDDAAGGLADIHTDVGTAITNIGDVHATDLPALKVVADLIEDILRNKMAITDATGNVVLYEDDNTTPKFSVAGLITDDATTTIRLRLV